MAKIGQILMSSGLLTQEGLDEALDWQVLYGGRLGTNLLELKLVEEEQLAHALGKQLGAEVAFGDIQIDPTLVSAIPAHVADRQEIVPWKLDKRRLKLLCCQIDVAQFDLLASKVGRACVPVIAPEYRIFQLLRAHYGATRQMRALDFGVVPEEGLAARRRKERAKEKERDAVEPAPELIDESAFNEIYSKVVAGRPPSGPPQAQEKPPSLPPRQEPAPTWQRPSAPEGPPVMAPAEAPLAPAPAETPLAAARAEAPLASAAAGTPSDEALLEELPADAILGDAEPEEALPLRQVTWDDLPVIAPLPAREEGPLEFRQALRALEGVTDRDSIAHIVLRASRSKAARALLLQVQGGVALGWDGLGEGTENARTVAIPLSADSAFSLVAKTRSHYMGPLQKTPLNIRFLAMLGKKVPLSSLVFPILHKGRVSHMLYLDNGHRQQAPTDVGEMLILSQRISQTVEALIERKRKAARG